MKDRWKILIVSVVTGVVLTLFLMFLGFSFRKVGLREFALLRYSFFGTVDAAQLIRSHGNYLVGVDYDFISYARGLVRHSFSVEVLSRDKSLLNVSALFIGQVIESEVTSLHFGYGPGFLELVERAVQRSLREAMEEFELREIVSQRQAVDAYLRTSVCLALQTAYPFLLCHYLSTGRLHFTASPPLLSAATPLQNYLQLILAATSASHYRANLLSAGGRGLLESVEMGNSEVFLQATKTILGWLATSPPAQVFAAAAYALDNPLMPNLNNLIPIPN